MNLKNVFFKIAIASAPAEKVVFQLFDKTVPLTAANFRALCTGEKGYGFKGSPFHRIIPGFMAQGGDIVSGNGYGGKSIYGSKFKDENFILKHTHPFMLSMANSGPDTNSSQFFITFAPCAWLDGKHVVFGRVAFGTEFIQTLEKRGSQSGAVKDKIIVTECGLVD